MRKLHILFGFAGIVALTACTDHEIVPPPVPLIDLDCECEATINDSLVSYNDSCYYSSIKNIVSGGISNARYQSLVKEEDVPGGLQIEVRSIEWSDDGSNSPTLADWTTFFTDNPDPDYSDNPGHNGVSVKWTDLNGKEWVSDTTQDACIHNFVFNSLIQESDTTGDYVKFDATFDCKLTNSDYTPDSVKCLENAHVRSAFRLD